MLRWFRSKKEKDLPLTPERAMKVTSVPEEYRFIKSIKCECNVVGELRVVRQALLIYGRRPMDELEAVCSKCGRTYRFYFDISDIQTPFGKMGENWSNDFLDFFDIKKKGESQDEF